MQQYSQGAEHSPAHHGGQKVLLRRTGAWRGENDQSGPAFRTIRAGLPAATPRAGTSCVTTAPAAITDRSPICTTLRIMARAPKKTPLPMLMGAARCT